MTWILSPIFTVAEVIAKRPEHAPYTIPSTVGVAPLGAPTTPAFSDLATVPTKRPSELMPTHALTKGFRTSQAPRSL